MLSWTCLLLSRSPTNGKRWRSSTARSRPYSPKRSVASRSSSSMMAVLMGRGRSSAAYTRPTKTCGASVSAEVAVPHFPGRYGKSHYGGARLLEGIFDLFTVCFLSRYLTRPAHVFGVFAVLAGLLGGTAALMPVVGPASLARPASVWVVGSALLLAFAGIFLARW